MLKCVPSHQMFCPKGIELDIKRSKHSYLLILEIDLIFLKANMNNGVLGFWGFGGDRVVFLRLGTGYTDRW